MQQWTLERYSESPESTGRHSLLQRDAKAFRTEPRNSYGCLSFRLSHGRGEDTDGDEADGRGSSSGPQRLSRHIPERSGVDMAVSAFHLVSTGSPRGCAAASPVTAPTPSSSAITSFTESMVSDDSSYLTSLYNDVLADTLMGPRGGASEDGSPGSGPRTGEVLRFTDETGPAARVASYTTKSTRTAAQVPMGRTRNFTSANSGGVHGGVSGGVGGVGGGAATRAFNTTPERVLDAPQFPADALQLLDWGANNSIAIGIGQSLYAWSGDSGQAAKVVDLEGAARIKCVQWLHKCSCIALSVQDGTTAIYDCRTSDFLRTVRLPAGAEVTGLTVKGPVLAVASDAAHGTTCAYDLRAKNALIATFEGHRGAVTSLHYCASEPYYLATGGQDGAVRVWDARRAATPRYAFDGVHQRAASVVRWDPQKRSRLFTGGEDGVLCLMDTHAPRRTMEVDNAQEEEGGGVGCSQEHLAQYVTRAVQTQQPISGLVCHPGSGEVLTAHRGKGQLQLRKASTFHLLSTFTAIHCDAPLSCLTMAPDTETVCAAQGDDTIKFWRVFDSGPARLGTNGRKASVAVDWHAMHGDQGGCLEEPLR